MQGKGLNSGRERHNRAHSPDTSTKTEKNLILFPLYLTQHLYLLGCAYVTKNPEAEYQAFTQKVLHLALAQFTPLSFLQTPPRVPGDSTMLTITSLLA